MQWTNNIIATWILLTESDCVTLYTLAKVTLCYYNIGFLRNSISSSLVHNYILSISSIVVLHHRRALLSLQDFQLDLADQFHPTNGGGSVTS